ncbi:MAG: DegT/DnrJ/EryC1/StrS family aminotransferase [Chloroflexi bacterium]|nr:DegT/DnrJ/EryC1/StrS family aminotransferase [Chloroflexota bacterium]
MDEYKICIGSHRVGDEELELLKEVVHSKWLTSGVQVEAFEKEFAEFAGVNHAVAMFNGTVALHALYVAMGVGPGIEVIVPSFTFISTATAVLYCGAAPVFADIDPDTFNLDPASAGEKISSCTKVIVPVHYGGQAADMDAFMKLADEYGLNVIEDAAESHGATYKGKSSGSLGDAAIFSFTPTKNITTGEGGMVTTNDGALADELKLLRNHGQSALYRHVRLGFNYRMTEMQAAIGRAQLKKLPAILGRKKEIAQFYEEKLSPIPGIKPPVESGFGIHPYMIYAVKVIESEAGISRDELMSRMEERGIQTRIYFPPAHTQPVFIERGMGDVSLPVTEMVAGQVLCLPCHSKLTDADLLEVTGAIEEALG